MRTRRTLPLWRSVFYVPVNVEKFVAGATQRGADAILLDLEDAIAVADKESARAALPAAIEVVQQGKADVGVRINRPLGLAIRDIEAAVRPGVSFLALPKVESAAHVQLLSEAVGEAELRNGVAPGTIGFLVIVETANGFMRIEEIARSDERIVALTLGSEDFSADCEFEPTSESLFMPKQVGLLAARAAGVLPLGFLGTVSNFADVEAFRATIRRSRTLGFVCGFAIHPSQIPILNAEFSPPSEDVAYARDLLAASAAVLSGGVGAVSFRGKMIDKPIIERAQRLVARADAIWAKDIAAVPEGESASPSAKRL